MQPHLEKVGLDWASFQVLRKANASLSKKAGVDPKVAADQRGYGIGANLEIYPTSDLAQKRATMNRLRNRSLSAARNRTSNREPGLTE